MKKMIKDFYELLTGLMFIWTIIAGYYKDISYMGEYCFISGIIVGIIFIISFINRVITKKDLPIWIYFDCMITILIIMIATIAIGLNLEGAFWFIHIINPILIFIYWCLFCNHQEISKKLWIATDTIFPLFYILFAFVLWKTTGKCPFPASMIFVEQPLWLILLSITVLIAIFLVLGFALHNVNRLINKKNNRLQNLNQA